MRKEPTIRYNAAGQIDTATMVKEAVSNISARVRHKYGLIDPSSVPDHVNYAKVEKYLRSVHVEVTRKMFASYIKEKLLPGGHDVINRNFSLYKHEQIIYYILVDMFKPILSLAKIKELFFDVLGPMIYLIGLDATYVRLCTNILSKMDSFENAVLIAVQDDIQTEQGHNKQPDNPADVVVQAIGSIAYYTQVESLCLAKGALDYYELTPDNLLP
jgi:hypothetical protein